jgi:CHAD domain-containing protein
MKKKHRRRQTSEFRPMVQSTVPQLLEEFLERSDAVLGHPARTAALHELRLAGKPLRYLLEFSIPFFGRALAADLEEVKGLVTLLGRIHDRDIHLPRARKHLAVIRRYNRAMADRNHRIPTAPLQRYVRTEREVRMAMYREACTILTRWRSEDFVGRVSRSLRYPAFD